MDFAGVFFFSAGVACGGPAKNFPIPAVIDSPIGRGSSVDPTADSDWIDASASRFWQAQRVEIQELARDSHSALPPTHRQIFTGEVITYWQGLGVAG